MRLHERVLLKQAVELHVFDFDDTLFASPTVPKGGDDREWWRTPESLDLSPGQERERKLPAADVAKTSIRNGAYTVVLTGRQDVPGMRDRIEAIVRALGISPDAVLLRDTSDSTPEFKRRTVSALLANMPNVRKVAMWDDMGDNLVAVSKAVAERNLPFDSHLVRAKHHIEHRLPTALEALEFLEMRLAGKVPWEEAKGFPLGTVRKWKDGNTYIKTKDGWVPHTPSQPAPKPKPEISLVPKPSAPPAEFKPKSSRKTKKFEDGPAGKTMEALYANPAAPENQKAVRDALNTLCGDFGMLDRDAGTAGAARLKMVSKTEIPNGVGGIHEWDGSIIVRDKSVSRAASLLESKATGQPGHPKGEKGMHVLVHEAVHGHSPIQRKQFKGRYRLLEEATTELAARKVMHDSFGTDWDKFKASDEGDYENGIGGYGEFCNALKDGVASALKRKGFKLPSTSSDWYDFLGEASVEMRRRPPPYDPDKTTYLHRFASSLPLSDSDLSNMGGAEAVKKEVAGAVWLSLKPAREREKLRTLLAIIKYGENPIQVMQAQAELPAQEKALEASIKEWFTYAAGGPLPENRVSRVLEAFGRLGVPEKVADEDAGMLPRNNIELAIAYARVLADQGELTGDALRDLALLQDDVRAASKALAAAVDKYGLKVGGATP